MKEAVREILADELFGSGDMNAQLTDFVKKLLPESIPTVAPEPAIEKSVSKEAGKVTAPNLDFQAEVNGKLEKMLAEIADAERRMQVKLDKMSKNLKAAPAVASTDSPDVGMASSEPPREVNSQSALAEGRPMLQAVEEAAGSVSEHEPQFTYE